VGYLSVDLSLWAVAGFFTVKRRAQGPPCDVFIICGWGKGPGKTGLNPLRQTGFGYMGSPRASGGITFIDHAFFCNFLLTKGLTQFNMAVDKTGNGKEVREKPRIIRS
jgi:hypothetical protein